MIRSSNHYLTSANTGKKDALHLFLTEYRRAMQICIDHIWELKLPNWNASLDLLNLPKYLNYKEVPYEGPLSARALCSALEQSVGIVRSSTQKRKQLLWVFNKLKTERKDPSYISSQLEKYAIIKPRISDAAPANLSSKCLDFDLDKEQAF